jgi:hypothetical protein
LGNISFIPGKRKGTMNTGLLELRHVVTIKHRI